MKSKRNDGKGFKSKNLFAERRRRQKLSDRLMSLRSIVPFITDMKKETIIQDAITYITQVEEQVIGLKDQLSALEEETGIAAAEIEKLHLEDEVIVTRTSETSFSLKIMCESQSRELTKLMEIVNSQGFEVTDINLTACRGATLIMCSVEVKR